MNTISNSQTPTAENYFGVKRPSKRWTALPEGDYRLLLRYLKFYEVPRHRAEALLAHVLHHKIAHIRPIQQVPPHDLVTSSRQVSFRIDDGPCQTAVLRHETGDNPAHEVISVSSLLGATLIGMRTGQRAPLLREDGTIRKLCVLNVARCA